ncbi:aminoglycoside phosphotransferase family protein [Pseudooctadecabacter jejudonensis]|uniref:Phosphotransferase enzyme family protein n=1 Tax=Pseudooctadecabacter jejudonensis TaxID=1391910 RepID=A0A1Y5SZL1_9RHOB|nr:aminoglycoside phosphotransferase family protein [Pseudooctadecabacter jejudonensis]SLN51747.1 Phosphotransferase enzyme family protein [Pseudooctadecabacter jejudonensis]
MFDTNSALGRRVNTMVREFADHMRFTGTPQVSRVFVSPVAPDERQVFRVALGDEVFAMKIDTTSAETGRLQDEFAGLEALSAHFANYDKLGTATPIYLSPGGAFFVMDYLAHQTAGQRLQGREQDQTARQVYRRAGMWLSALHDFKPKKKGQFHGRWMLVEIDERLAAGQMQAPRDLVERYRAQLSQQVETTGNTKDIRAWCHGDFHSENIMMGPGMTYAFDLTETRMKMALYDAVDFLKVDVFRPYGAGDVDPSGLIAAHREMFFKGYKPPVKQHLFEIAMRGRLLIDWVDISRQAYTTKDVDRRRYDRIAPRLEIAFGLSR